MSQPATHDPVSSTVLTEPSASPASPLVSLLQREFSPEFLVEALGPQTATLEKYWQLILGDPLHSMAQRTGKALRSRLLVIAWAIAGGRAEVPAELIGIVEGLHLGSLIIDDIEDGSNTRRGGPTLHQQIGVPNALNAGNWLYFWPALLVPRLGLAPDRELQLRCAIDRAVLNAHYGQALDLALHVTDLRQPDVAQVVHASSELKTGCLMELGARIGAIAAGGNRDCVDRLGRIGLECGIALQMLDDLTSVLCERRRHKGSEDVVLARPTWAWAWFAQSVDELSYGRLRLQLQRVLEGQGDPEEVVAALASRVEAIGRARIAEQLATTVARAESHFGGSDACNELKQWARELANYEG